MKKILFLVVIALSLVASNCKDKSISREECAPVVKAMMENVAQAAGDVSPEEKEKAKMMLTPIIEKECMSGKYSLDCLKTAKSPAELQLCLKKD